MRSIVYRQFRRNCISSKRSFVYHQAAVNTAFGWWYAPTAMIYTLTRDDMPSFTAWIKKERSKCFVLFWLPLLDLLFCGKATAVASVHRTLAKSRLSSPTKLGSNGQEKEHHPIGWCSLDIFPKINAPNTAGFLAPKQLQSFSPIYRSSSYKHRRLLLFFV